MDVQQVMDVTGLEKEEASALLISAGSVGNAIEAFLHQNMTELDKKLTGDAPDAPAVVASKPVGDGMLAVVHGDLLQDAAGVDCIVNPANERLQHAGGLARVISDAAGEALDDACAIIVSTKPGTRLEEGDAVITTGGRLRCAHVIHTVAPMWSGPKTAENPLATVLGRAAVNTFKGALSAGLASVAMPAIGTGIFGTPVDVCARVLVCEAALLLMERRSVRTVRLTNHDRGTVDVFAAGLDAGLDLARRRFAAGDRPYQVAPPPIPRAPRPIVPPVMARNVSTTSTVYSQQSWEDSEYEYEEEGFDSPSASALDGPAPSTWATVQADVAEVNTFDGFVAGCATDALGQFYVWLGITPQRLQLEAETAQAWGMQVAPPLVYRIKFDKLYNLGSDHPTIEFCCQTRAEDLNVKDLPADTTSTVSLSWFVMNRVRNAFFKNSDNWPPRLESRTAAVAEGSLPVAVAEAAGCSVEVATLALDRSRNNKDTAILLVLSKREELEAESAGMGAGAGHEVVDLTAGAAEEYPPEVHANASDLAEAFPDVPHALLCKLLSKNSNMKDRAGSRLLAHNGNAVALEAELLSDDSDDGVPPLPLPLKRSETKTHPSIATRAVVPFDPAARDPKEVEATRWNLLMRVLLYTEERMRGCHTRCLVCDTPLEFVGLKPSVCDNATCLFSAETFGLAVDIGTEMRLRPQVSDLLISFLHSFSMLPIERVELMFPNNVFAQLPDGSTLSFTKPGGHADVPLLRDVIKCIPPVAEMQGFHAKPDFDAVHPLLYPLLQWLFTTNRGHVRVLKRNERLNIPGAETQFVLQTGPVKREAEFQRDKAVSGSFFAFHGSSFGNWHSIVRRGLMNLSNTKLMSAGAAMGQGIYLANAAGTSMGYSAVGNSWSKSQFMGMSCMALCEVIDRGDEFTAGGSGAKGKDNAGVVWVVPNEAYVTTRFFVLVKPRATASASVMASKVLPAIPPRLEDVDAHKRAVGRKRKTRRRR